MSTIGVISSDTYISAKEIRESGVVVDEEIVDEDRFLKTWICAEMNEFTNGERLRLRQRKRKRVGGGYHCWFEAYDDGAGGARDDTPE